MKPIKTVDAYIASTPKEVQKKLRELREAIKSVFPDVEEKISYGMPYYSYKGRLAYFRLATHHIGLYIPTPIVDEFKDQLKEYHAVQATIQLPLDKELPVALIKKMIAVRMKKNDEAAMK